MLHIPSNLCPIPPHPQHIISFLSCLGPLGSCVRSFPISIVMCPKLLLFVFWLVIAGIRICNLLCNHFIRWIKTGPLRFWNNVQLQLIWLWLLIHYSLMHLSLSLSGQPLPIDCIANWVYYTCNRGHYEYQALCPWNNQSFRCFTPSSPVMACGDVVV